MEPSTHANVLWNALVAGPGASGKAIADFIAMPDLKREAALTHFFTRAIVAGDPSSKAVADFSKMPVPKHEAALTEILLRAERFVADLIKNKGAYDPEVPNVERKKLLSVLDAIPSLATTAETRALAAEKIEAIDKLAQSVFDINISMKCEEIMKKLRVSAFGDLRGPRIIILSFE